MSEDTDIRPHRATCLGGQARSDQAVGDEKEYREDKAHDSRSPRKSHRLKEVLKEKGKDDAAHGATGGGNARGRASRDHEEVADRRHSRREDQRRAHASENGKGEDEVPVL